MAIVRTVEWKLRCSAEEADARIREAFTQMELDPEGAPGSIPRGGQARDPEEPVVLRDHRGNQSDARWLVRCVPGLHACRHEALRGRG